MKLKQLILLSECIDGPAPGEDGFDVYGPKPDVVLVLVDDDEPVRHMIASFSIQENTEDDCMALCIDLAGQDDAVSYNLNDDGDLPFDLNIEIFRRSRQ